MLNKIPSNDEDTEVRPIFTYSDIKFAESEAVFKRATDLFTGGKVTNFHEVRDGFQAIVMGTNPYGVRIHYKNVSYADCDCYLGQNDSICKHMLAVALMALNKYGLVDDKGYPINDNTPDPTNAKQHIAAAIRKVRSYDGPSSLWFEYQRKLDVAAGMIEETMPLFEPTQENLVYLWKIVLKLSKKLSHGGVDDSNGTIGGAIYAVIERIVEIANQNEKFNDWAVKHCTEYTGFGFEDELQSLLAKTKS